MKIDKKALVILTDDEKASLYLQHGEGKSSWQAGEILNRSHYKYLEIKYRAEKFIKMFTEHFLLYPGIIPPAVVLDEDFENYIKYCILERLTLPKAIAKISNPLYQRVKSREEELCRHLAVLRDSKDGDSLNLYNLLIEFDRYNNFRIMPRPYQEPSAFKRRNSTRFKKHLKIAVSLTPLSLFRIKTCLENNSPKLKTPAILPLVNLRDNNYELVRVACTEENLDRVSNVSLYLFKSESMAVEFAELVLGYFNGAKRSPRVGLQFWPKFRVIIKNAINYNKVNSIAPNRKHFDAAIRDMDSIFERGFKSRHRNKIKRIS